MPDAANKRAHTRFLVPGAMLSYEKETCPVVNLARGGLGFTTNRSIKPGQKLSVLLTYSEKDAPIQLHGQAVYCVPNPGKGNPYTVGISFAPFAAGAGNNLPEFYRILEQLELRSAAERSRPVRRRASSSRPAAGP